MSARTARNRASETSVGRSVPPTPTPAPSTTARSSISSLSTAASASTISNRIPLPEYQPPSYPLTPAARDQLKLLLDNYPANTLSRHLKEACIAINDRAGDINDSRHEVNEKTTKKRKKREHDGEPPDEEAEERMNEYGRKVDSLTARLEASLRRAIDGEQGVETLKKALNDTHKKSSVAASSQQQPRQTQQQTQATTQVTLPGSFPADDVDANNAPASAASAPPPTLTPAFTELHQSYMDAYASLAPYSRYAKHNAYIGFKNTVHDSYHAEDGKAVPHASTWFDANGDVPPPGVTSTANEDGDDDDMAVASARISTKCPVSLTEFEDPVTSRLCSHSYERSSFEQLWDNRPVTQGEGPRRVPLQGVECPVPGCKHRLEKEDVESDPVVVRRIKRLQAVAKARAERTARGYSESSGEENCGRARKSQNKSQVIDSGNESNDDDSADDVDAVTQEQRPRERTKTPAIKKEKMRRVARRGAVDDIEEMDDDD